MQHHRYMLDLTEWKCELVWPSIGNLSSLFSLFATKHEFGYRFFIVCTSNTLLFSNTFINYTLLYRWHYYYFAGYRLIFICDVYLLSHHVITKKIKHKTDEYMCCIYAAKHKYLIGKLRVSHKSIPVKTRKNKRKKIKHQSSGTALMLKKYAP